MTRYRMVPVERTPQMIQAGRAEYEKTLIGGRDKVLLADERRWAGELSAAPSPWRPISECPDDNTEVAAIQVIGAQFNVHSLPGSVARRLPKFSYFMLASDFPLPVGNAT